MEDGNMMREKDPLNFFDPDFVKKLRHQDEN